MRLGFPINYIVSNIKMSLDFVVTCHGNKLQDLEIRCWDMKTVTLLATNSLQKDNAHEKDFQFYAQYFFYDINKRAYLFKL